MLVKPLHFKKPLYFWLLAIIFLASLLASSRFIYDKLREPDKYIPEESIIYVQPAEDTSGKVVVKKPETKALLPGAKWVPQTFNNCGPATTSMILQYFGHNVDQEATKAALRTNHDDKNVFTYEIADYIRTYGVESKLLFDGDVEILKTLVANGFYVMVEDWLHPNEDIGHVTIIRGYDDEEGVFIADDSYIGIDITYPYEEFDQTQWKPFNREYLPIFKPGNEELLRAIIGESWDQKKMYEKAVKAAKEEISANDQDMHAWFNLGTSYFALGKHKEAKDAFEKSQSLGWPKRMLWYQIQPIKNYNALAYYPKAIELANTALAGNDSFAEAHLEKAIAYLGMGDAVKAENEAQISLQYAPNFAAAKDFLESLNK